MRLHCAYCRGRTIADVAAMPIARGVGLGRSRRTRTQRISRAFHERGLYVRSYSETTQLVHARRNPTRTGTMTP